MVVDVVGLGLVAADLPEVFERGVLGLCALGQLGEPVEVRPIADRGFQLGDPGRGVGSRLERVTLGGDISEPVRYSSRSLVRV